MRNKQLKELEVSPELEAKIIRLLHVHGDLYTTDLVAFDKVGNFFRKQTEESITVMGKEPKWWRWKGFAGTEILYDGFFGDLEQFMISEGLL